MSPGLIDKNFSHEDCSIYTYVVYVVKYIFVEYTYQ